MLQFEPLEDWSAVINRLTAFIAASVEARGGNGALLGISGGIDSAVVAALAVEALGAENVHACMLPDMDSGEDMLRDAHSVTEWLGIRNVLVRDITPVLRVLGTYELFGDLYALSREERLQRIGERKRALLGAGDGARGGTFLESYRRKADAGLNRVRSLWNSKIRCRMVMLYAQAELHNLLVLGTTNRSEYLTGWFTKYGDGAVDLEVILPLYKTRVSELAVKLDVPGAIRAKTPSGDILPGVTDEEMLGVPYSVLDRILLGLQRKLAETDIACSLEIGLETVRRVAALISSSRFSREGALFPDLVID